MIEEGIAALTGLREVRDRLSQSNAPRRVNLRSHIEPDGPAWNAYVRCRGFPGRKVRRATMLANINHAIDVLTAELLGQEAPSPQPIRRETSRTPMGHFPVAPPSRTAELRRFKPAGIEAAKQFLEQVRENPAGSTEPPDRLLFDLAYSDSVPGAGAFEQRAFATRREAADYLAPRLAPIASRIVDQAGVWSWLGMYYFSETAPRNGQPARLSPLDETFVVDRSDGRSFQLRYRHYLWIAWRLLTQHGEQARFLLDQPLTSWPHIAVRCLGSTRIFNSRAVIPLILRLYTGGGVQKRGYINARGGLTHLFRVLDQLERTHDVYGMDIEALLAVLPPEFAIWDGERPLIEANS